MTKVTGWTIVSASLSWTFSVLVLAVIKLRITVSPCVFLLGIFMGAIKGFFASPTVDDLVDSDWEQSFTFSFTFPLIIFNLVVRMDLQSLLKCWSQVLILSLVGILINLLVVGAIIKMLVEDLPASIPIILMFGLLCVPTYPVEVLPIVKMEGVGCQHLITLLEGETIIGVVVIMGVYNIVVGAAMNALTNVSHFSLFFIRYFSIATVFGLITGKLGIMLLHTTSNHAIICVALFTSIPLICTFIADEFLGISSELVLVIHGVILNNNKRGLNVESLEMVLLVLNVFTNLINYYTMYRTGCVIGFKAYMDYGGYDFPLIIVTYIITMFGRLAMFLVLSPMISRLGPGLNFRQMIICVWCGVKGILNQIILLGGVRISLLRGFQGDLMGHISGMIILTMVINVPLLKTLLSFLGMDVISVPREINMNNCMKHIFNIRDRSIAILKLDRNKSDSNWPLVNQTTLLQHPYKKNMTDNEENEVRTIGRKTICPNPNCGKVVVCEPTPKEYEEMILEARKRVLNAKKVSYSRQFENGMISLSSVRILHNSIEVGLENPRVRTNVDELLRMFKIKPCQEYLYRLSIKFSYDEQMDLVRPPRKQYRRICYKIMKSFTFDILMSVIVIISCVHVVLLLITIAGWPKVQETAIIKIDSVLSIFYAFIFTMEFMIKILGYSFIYIWEDGFKSYFRSRTNTFDFAILLTTHFTAFTGVLDLIGNLPHQDVPLIINSLVQSSRILRLYRLVVRLAPSLAVLINNTILSKISHAYDVGKGFVTAEQEILEIISLMIDDEKVCKEVRDQMEADKQATIIQLGVVQKEYPLIALNVKTRAVIRTILNGMMDAVQELKGLGWVDEPERLKFMTSIKDSVKSAEKIKKIEPNSPQVYVEEVSYLFKQDILTKYLLKNLVIKKYEAGEVLIEEDSPTPGIFVIISGLFKIIYSPKVEVMEVYEKYGALPIVDYIMENKFQRSYVSYLVAGNTCGELGILTGRNYSCNIVADSFSTVYVIKAQTIREALDMDSHPIRGLRARMWKAISSRLAAGILLQTPAYYSVSQPQVRMSVEMGFSPDLPSQTRFINHDLIEDIILINGQVVDFETKNVYLAPCYIPRQVEIMIITKDLENNELDIETRFLIIPINDVPPSAIMNKEASCLQMIPDVSKSLLPTHLMQRESFTPSMASQKNKSKKPFFFASNINLESEN